MSIEQKKYDSTLARVAGNAVPGLLAGGFYTNNNGTVLVGRLAADAIAIAQAIIENLERSAGAPPGERP